MDERPAPVVTIIDPGRAGPAADVVSGGREREPWRPSRRQLRAVALLAVLAVAVVLPQQLVAARAEHRRSATAAADAVRVAAYSTSSPDGLVVRLANAGPEAVRVLDLQVVGPGYRVQQVGRRLPLHGDLDVAVRDTRACGEGLVEDGGDGLVRLRVRTRAGREVARTLVLPGDTWLALLSAAQRRCGYLAPFEAVRTSVTTAVGDRSLGLRLRMENRGRVPLRLVSLAVTLGGVDDQVTPRLPLLLAAGTSRAVTVDLRVTVQECGVARDLLDEGGAEQGHSLVQATVRPVRPDGSEGPPQDVLVASLEGEQGLRDLVAGRCPVVAG